VVVIGEVEATKPLGTFLMIDITGASSNNFTRTRTHRESGRRALLAAEVAMVVEMVVVGPEAGDEAAAGARSEEAGAPEEVAPVPQQRHPARWLAALCRLHPRDRHPRSSP
jgi:mannose/fructose-specific phosphotransferase system component IIA